MSESADAPAEPVDGVAPAAAAKSADAAELDALCALLQASPLPASFARLFTAAPTIALSPDGGALGVALDELPRLAGAAKRALPAAASPARRGALAGVRLLANASDGSAWAVRKRALLDVVAAASREGGRGERRDGKSDSAAAGDDCACGGGDARPTSARAARHHLALVLAAGAAEAAFSSLVLSASPKAAEAWEHREWLFSRVTLDAALELDGGSTDSGGGVDGVSGGGGPGGGAHSSAALNLVDAELSAAAAAERARPRCYAAGCHRARVFAALWRSGAPPRVAAAAARRVLRETAPLARVAPADASRWHARALALAALARADARAGAEAARLERGLLREASDAAGGRGAGALRSHAAAVDGLCRLFESGAEGGQAP